MKFYALNINPVNVTSYFWRTKVGVFLRFKTACHSLVAHF